MTGRRVVHRGRKRVEHIRPQVDNKLLYRWKNEMLERLPGVFERGQAESNEAEQRIAELERMVGRLALENEILKNAANWRESHRRRNGK